MSNKGFTDNQTSIETPNDIGVAEKPLTNKIHTKQFCKSSYWVKIWLTHVHYGFQIQFLQL